jgi:hypothetical protein
MPGLWSKTYKCWYVEYSKEKYNALRSLFPELVILREADPPVREPSQGSVKHGDAQAAGNPLPATQMPLSANEATNSGGHTTPGRKKSNCWKISVSIG